MVAARVLVRPADTAQVSAVLRLCHSRRQPAYLEISRTRAEIATMRALKAALDPRGILNPGKVIDVH